MSVAHRGQSGADSGRGRQTHRSGRTPSTGGPGRAPAPEVAARVVRRRERWGPAPLGRGGTSGRCRTWGARGQRPAATPEEGRGHGRDGRSRGVSGARRGRRPRRGQAPGTASCGGGDARRRGRGQQARVGRAQCAAGARWSCAGVGTAEVSARERGGAHGGGVGTRAVGSGRSDEVDRRRGRGGSDGKWRRVDDEARPRLHLGAA